MPRYKLFVNGLKNLNNLSPIYQHFSALASKKICVCVPKQLKSSHRNGPKRKPNQTFYCLLISTDKQDFEKILAQPIHRVDGVNLQVSEYIKKGASAGIKDQKERTKVERHNFMQKMHRIAVYGIPEKWSTEDLCDTLSIFGKVIKSRFVELEHSEVKENLSPGSADHREPTATKIAHVWFQDLAEAQKATKLKVLTFEGGKLKIYSSIPDEEDEFGARVNSKKLTNSAGSSSESSSQSGEFKSFRVINRVIHRSGKLVHPPSQLRVNCRRRCQPTKHQTFFNHLLSGSFLNCTRYC